MVERPPVRATANGPGWLLEWSAPVRHADCIDKYDYCNLCARMFADWRTVVSAWRVRGACVRACVCRF